MGSTSDRDSSLPQARPQNRKPVIICVGEAGLVATDTYKRGLVARYAGLAALSGACGNLSHDHLWCPGPADPAHLPQGVA